jgi:Domain of unknown function (DUF4260)
MRKLGVERNCALRRYNSQPAVVGNFSRSPQTKLPYRTRSSVSSFFVLRHQSSSLRRITCQLAPLCRACIGARSFQVGYMLGVRLGSALYNLIHAFVSPLLLIALSIFYKQLWLLPYGLRWTAHIGVDRLLGFGLKYPNPISRHTFCNVCSVSKPSRFGPSTEEAKRHALLTSPYSKSTVTVREAYWKGSPIQGSMIVGNGRMCHSDAHWSNHPNCSFCGRS